MRARTLGFLLAAAALLAGCGGAEAGRRPPDDRALAQRAVVRPGDLPAGWKDRGPLRAFGCLAGVKAGRASTAWALSHQFDQGDHAELATAVFLYRDEAAAAREFERFSAGESRCFARKLTRTMRARKGIAAGSAKTTELAVAPAGDQHTGTHTEIALSGPGGGVHVRVDLVFVRQDRALSFGAFIGTGQRFDAALRERLTSIQAHRLGA